jgi:copper ion binding protein
MKGNAFMTDTLTRVELSVPGINCGHCEMTIKEEVGALAGVNRVEPSNQTKSVVIDYDSATVTPEQIKAALAEAGYPVQE